MSNGRRVSRWGEYITGGLVVHLTCVDIDITFYATHRAGLLSHRLGVVGVGEFTAAKGNAGIALSMSIKARQSFIIFFKIIR